MSKASGIKAGAAYVELAMRDKISEPLRRAEKRMELFGERVKEIGSSVAMAGAAVAAFGGAIVGAAAASVAAFTKIAGDFSDLAAQTGLSVEIMSELETALKDAGSNVEEFSKSVVKMRRFISEAAQGSKGAVEALDRLGLSAEDLIGLSADEQFLRIADALSKVKNPTDRLALAMELFGKSAYKMLPVLEAGGAGIEEFRRKAREMGFSLSGETADAADALGTQIEILQDQFGRIAVAIGEALLPVANAFVAVMQGLVGRVIEFIRENQGLVLGVTAAGVALLAVGTAVGTVGAAIVGLGAVFASVGAIIGALGPVVAALMTPIGAVVAAVAATAGVAIYASGAFGTLWDAGVKSAESVRDAWSGVTDAISASDYQLAGRIAMKALEVAVQEGLGALRVAITQYLTWMIDAWQKSVRLLFPLLDGLLGAIDLAFGTTFSKQLEQSISGAFDAIVQGRRDIEEEAVAPLRDELGDLIDQAKRARSNRQKPAAPDIGEPTLPEMKPPKEPKIPKVPALKAPALPDLAPAQAEIQARMSAMGGFNAAALGGMFGDSGSKIEEHTKKSAEALQKILELGKRQRDSLVWS